VTVSWTSGASDIMGGAEVYGFDGGKVGTIAQAYPGYIVVEKGFFFPTDYYIPRSAISEVRDGRVYLNVSKDDALQHGWETQPADLQTATGVLDSIANAGVGIADVGRDQVVGATRIDEGEEIRIPVIEEELTATVRPRQAGEVRIEKDVVTEERTIDVPLTEERVRVEHRIVNRPVTAADTGAFEETVIEVPVRSETVDVQKQARVAEEIVISKEAVQRTERVSDTVRKEEVHVDEDTLTDPALYEEETGSTPAV
jgi:uncharacterized protein (TIGR02271 family)